MARVLLHLRPVVVALLLAAVLHGTASASDSSKPVPPPGGHDVTKPAVMAQVSAAVAAAKMGSLQPRSGPGWPWAKSTRRLAP